MTATENLNDPPSPDTSTTTHIRRPDRWASRTTVPRSRMGGVWVTLVVATFVLLLLLVFILQNGQRAEVSFLSAHGNLPMGVALLLAAIFGVLVVALPGTARILQLRMLSRRRGAHAATRSGLQRPDQPDAVSPNGVAGTHR